MSEYKNEDIDLVLSTRDEICMICRSDRMWNSERL